jgi:hypothetical protein
MTNAQVSEFSFTYTEDTDFSERQLADLGKRRPPRDRRILDDPAERYRKYEIETGIMRDGTIRSPLEAWTCPGPRSKTMGVYFRIMRAEPGSFQVSDFKGRELAAVHWMSDQRLIGTDEALRIHPLSDAAAPGRRSYPGAPVSDRRAKVGIYLRGSAVGLVAAALFNHSAGQLRRKTGRRAALIGADGMRATVALICAEANRIKSKRADLAEHRYLSLTRCAEIIRSLIGMGWLEELSATRFIRQERSWRTVVRVIRRLICDNADDAATAALAAWETWHSRQ